ncbi:hypothetical protein A3Q56_07184 [Intoshia linei]|uniref:Casein kinase II subunit beta n=1 Tax=Intoshia linei TaxID=1819745 RepID=A0A177ATD0_9BILA|nr:hypothetical protein A3Q56_07184 [Intoshia linei]
MAIPKRSKQNSLWLTWFLNQEIGLYMVKVDLHYIQDAFNTFGLDEHCEFYQMAYKEITNSPMGLLTDTEADLYAEQLYGLIHARFILTEAGISLMIDKYNEVFDKCPRYLCYNTTALPIGLNSSIGVDTTQLFCPSCKDIFKPPRDSALNKIDGAYFGPNFPHMFLMANPKLIPVVRQEKFIGKLFGFKIKYK